MLATPAEGSLKLAPILHALQRTFEAAGYEVIACADPAQALDRLREKPFQVLSADYMMPGMTGAEFLAQAKALQPETIRILLTAAHDFSAAVDAVNNGEIFRILAKPWNRVELLGTVRQAFDTYALERMTISRAAGGDFVLVNLFRGPVGAPMRPRTIGDLLAAASRRAGLATAVTPHQLRHAFGSSAADAGCGIDVVADLLGHASVSSSQVYVHPDPGRLRAAVDAVPSPREQAGVTR